MIKIIHRVNKNADLKNISLDMGVEVDIRSKGNELIIHHDPFENGEKFEDWLIHYNHKFLILNVSNLFIKCLLNLITAMHRLY